MENTVEFTKIRVIYKTETQCLTVLVVLELTDRATNSKSLVEIRPLHDYIRDRPYRLAILQVILYSIVTSTGNMPKPRWYLVAIGIVVWFTCAFANADPSPRLIFSRAAASDEDRRWPHVDVFYTFGTDLLRPQDRSMLFAIRDAMDIWEEATCLRFFFRTVQPDYLEFTLDDEGRCTCARGYYPCCSSVLVGNNGGKQAIKLG